MTAPDDAAVRVTANQKRAAMHVLDNRNAYPTMDELGEAIALAVVCAEDATKARYVVCVREPTGAFYVYGSYATFETAHKATQIGLGMREGARGGVFPLIPVPRSPATAQQVKPAKKATPKKREMS